MGVPIGLKLTGVLAQVFMLCWYEKLARGSKAFGVVQMMTGRYVDDIKIAAEATRLGLRYRDGQQSFVEEDKKLPSFQKTMELIKQIGDGIYFLTKLELDYPSRHVSGKLPF